MSEDTYGISHADTGSTGQVLVHRHREGGCVWESYKAPIEANRPEWVKAYLAALRFEAMDWGVTGDGSEEG